MSARGQHAGWSDAELLDMLDMKARGDSRAEIAEAMRPRKGYLYTPSAIGGILHRIRTEAAACFPAADDDGTMPPRWWAAGLRARQAEDAA